MFGIKKLRKRVEELEKKLSELKKHDHKKTYALVQRIGNDGRKYFRWTESEIIEKHKDEVKTKYNFYLDNSPHYLYPVTTWIPSDKIISTDDWLEKRKAEIKERVEKEEKKKQKKNEEKK